MNQSYSKQIQLRDLEIELQALDDDSQKLTGAIISETNSVDRNKLKRRQTDLFQDMEKVQQQLIQLIYEIWKELESPEYASLCKIINSINRELVNNAYQLSLPKLSHSQIPVTIESLVLKIATLPDESDESHPLQRFLSTLIGNEFLSTQHKNELKTWAKKQSILTVSPSTELQMAAVEICLMIKVVSLPPGKYMVSGALVRNPDPWRTKEALLDTIPIDLPFQFNSGCSKEQLQDILCELIATCGAKYSIPLSQLTVQWFLPIELMSLDVEHWVIPIGRQQHCSGKRCKSVMIRCADRHFFSDYDFSVVEGEWKENWKCIAPTAHCHQVLDRLDPMTGNTNLKANKAGCSFIEHQDSEQQEVLWDQWIGEGLPIALWSRQSGATKRKAQGVIKSVTNCVVADLPTSLTQHRQKNPDSIATNAAVAVHLSLLWDNPFLRFPSLDYRSD